MALRTKWAALLLCLASSSAFAFNPKAPIGWAVYNTQPIQQVQKHTQPVSQTQVMLAINKIVVEARDKAVLNPTMQNVDNYLHIQRAVTNMASSFTRTWQMVLLSDPSLDYNLTFPSQSVARRVYSLTQQQDQAKAIAAIAKTYGFVYFYQGRKMLDQRLNPTLAMFFREHHFAVIADSVDGKLSNAFPDSVVAPDKAQALGVHYFPALVMINPKTKQVRPVFYGYIAINQLKARILELHDHFAGWLK